MHREITGYGSDDHNGRKYNIRTTKNGCLIVRIKRYIKAMPIKAEENLKNGIRKTNPPQIMDKLMKWWTFV